MKIFFNCNIFAVALAVSIFFLIIFYVLYTLGLWGGAQWLEHSISGQGGQGFDACSLLLRIVSVQCKRVRQKS